MTVKTYISGVSEKDRAHIRNILEDLVKAKSIELSYPDEAIIQEIRYWQQKYTNPKKDQKTRSFKHHKQICHHCHEKISGLKDATFHHIERGVPNLHGPKNMVPMHKSKKCHEKHHGVNGSF